MTDIPLHPASQVLAEAAAALHTIERTDGKDWTALTEDEKVPYIARTLRPTLAVILTTRPAGWEALAAEIGTVNRALAHRQETGATTCGDCQKDKHHRCDGQRWSDAADTLVPCTCNCAYAMENRARNNQVEDPPTLRLRDRHAQKPHLRVQAPCLIHPGQTIDIDLTDGTVTVKDTP